MDFPLVSQQKCSKGITLWVSPPKAGTTLWVSLGFLPKRRGAPGSRGGCRWLWVSEEPGSREAEQPRRLGGHRGDGRRVELGAAALAPLQGAGAKRATPAGAFARFRAKRRGRGAPDLLGLDLRPGNGNPLKDVRILGSPKPKTMDDFWLFKGSLSGSKA